MQEAREDAAGRTPDQTDNRAGFNVRMLRRGEKVILGGSWTK